MLGLSVTLMIAIPSTALLTLATTLTVLYIIRTVGKRREEEARKR